MERTQIIQKLKDSQRSDDFDTLKQLHKNEQRQWFVLATVTVLVTVGLALAVGPALQEALANLWPWANTNIVLLAGFAVSIAMLIGYLTWQQVKSRAIRERVHRLAEESARREKQNTARLHALLNVSRMMGSVTSRESVFDTITRVCLETFACEQSSLMLVRENGKELEMRAATGHKNHAELMGTRMQIGEGIAGWVAETQQPLILNRDTDMSKYPKLKLNNKNLSAAMVVPIVVRDELVGVLNVSARSDTTSYTVDDLQALQVFAENAGTSIRHAEHVEWMRQTIQQLQEAHQEKQREEKVHDITT